MMAIHQLLNNRDERILDSDFILGVEPRRDGRTCKLWFELDCDKRHKAHMLCAKRQGPNETNRVLAVTEK